MATITEPLTETTAKKRNLVEMNWDPITRIVGSLGIFTKIDFEARKVAENLVFDQGFDPVPINMGV